MSYKGNKKWPGMVTSVRDRKAEKDEKEKLLKRKKDEEEREKALRKSQEEVARFLENKGKYPEEYKPPIREKEPRRKHSPERSRRRSREKSQDRRYAKERSRTPQKSRSPPVSRRSEEAPRRPESSRGARRRFEEALREEEWEAGGTSERYSERPAAAAVSSFEPEETGGWVSSASGKEDAGGWVVLEEATEYEAQKRQAAQEKKNRNEEEKRRKAKLANAFAFGNEDDDDKREQERIAAAKQAADQWKEEIRSRVRPKQADVQGTRPRIDMYTALKMIADFKRSCNGKAKPMPPEIVEATAIVTGAPITPMSCRIAEAMKYIEKFFEKQPESEKEIATAATAATAAGLQKAQLLLESSVETVLISKLGSLKFPMAKRLGELWKFPSDHPPIAAVLTLGKHSIKVASWNVLNRNYYKYIEQDTQGLKGSEISTYHEAGTRENKIIEKIQEMLQKEFHILCLQECWPELLEQLKGALGHHGHHEMECSGQEQDKNQEAYQ